MLVKCQSQQKLIFHLILTVDLVVYVFADEKQMDKALRRLAVFVIVELRTIQSSLMGNQKNKNTDK